MIGITNATKAHVIAVVNAALGVLVAYGDLTSDQQVAIIGAVNSVAAAWIALTYKKSRKRFQADS